MRAQPTPEVTWRRLAALLGALAFAVVLAAHHITDGDLWGKLAVGAYFWHFGTVPDHDLFAFTPVLPHYIEHEWGAGTIFFGVLKYVGPAGLMLLKIVLAFGALLAALAAGKKRCSLDTLLVLAIPVSACLLLGYIPVIRSHAFTYCFFALTLLGLEGIGEGKKWPIWVLPPMFLVWSNVHGGFVAGLGAVFVYTAYALATRRQWKWFLIAAVASSAVTLVNIYGLKYWVYLIPALLNKRPLIAEWAPLPFWGNDAFNSFRLLFVIVVIALLAGWRRVERKNWPGLLMLAITATLAWRSRRHAPFFAVSSLAVAGPYLQATLVTLAAAVPERIRQAIRPAAAVAVLYGAAAIYVAAAFLPQASLQVLAPVGHDAVREADILSLAHAKGNLATPFGWGCYLYWRLSPDIKISMDGRYETTYSEATFDLNNRFYEHRGPHWDDLVHQFKVDYVILEYTEERLRPADLAPDGYVLIWETPGHSALLCLPEHADELKRVAANLPPTTINPLDAHIPDAWWRK
jgi:hypothetical protein